jgi:hypothetical protein
MLCLEGKVCIRSLHLQVTSTEHQLFSSAKAIKSMKLHSPHCFFIRRNVPIMNFEELSDAFVDGHSCHAFVSDVGASFPSLHCHASHCR